MSESAASPPVRTPGAAPNVRIVSLDVLRGFALCGILLVNVQPIAVRAALISVDDQRIAHGVNWLGLLAEQRFFPIFSLLFGIGFSLLLRSATARADHPRLILLRRLLVLLGIGVLHHLVWNGDILVLYAIAGIVVLLPSTWLPRAAVAGLSVVLLVAAFVIYGGGSMIVPGLFLLGSALTRFGVVDRFDSAFRAPVVIGTIAALLSAAALWWQVSDPASSLALGIAGPLLATTYVCLLLALMRTGARRILRFVFEPLGRMALTNYLTATILVLAAASVLGSASTWSPLTTTVIAGAVLLLQWCWSTLWLRRFTQGPIEWLWRWATWARRPPLVRPEPVRRRG